MPGIWHDARYGFRLLAREPGFALVPVALGIVTAIACVVPARRAANVDPLTVLRST